MNSAYFWRPFRIPGQENTASHSSFEPMMSNLVTVDSIFNVGYTNKSASAYNTTAPSNNRATIYQNMQFGYMNPLDTAGDTVFDWLFKQYKGSDGKGAVSPVSNW